MKKIRITAIRKACYDDLMAKYENPIQNACPIREGQIFIANGWKRPKGFCQNLMGRKKIISENLGQ